MWNQEQETCFVPSSVRVEEKSHRLGLLGEDFMDELGWKRTAGFEGPRSHRKCDCFALSLLVLTVCRLYGHGRDDARKRGPMEIREFRSQHTRGRRTEDQSLGRPLPESRWRERKFEGVNRRAFKQNIHRDARMAGPVIDRFYAPFERERSMWTGIHKSAARLGLDLRDAPRTRRESVRVWSRQILRMHPHDGSLVGTKKK
jgi:hypothetical protein